MRASVPAVAPRGQTLRRTTGPIHRPSADLMTGDSGPGPAAIGSNGSLARRLAMVLGSLLAILLLLTSLSGLAAPAVAALDDDRYDGNIFALYAGNGSLVPPRSNLAQALSDGRPAVVIYYLDDSSVSKRFAPVVSELQRLWGQAIDLIPLVTDPLQNRPIAGPGDPAAYWGGTIPQVVVFDQKGQVVFDASGQVDVDAINQVVSQVTGIAMAPRSGNSATMSFNELNSEVVPSR